MITLLKKLHRTRLLTVAGAFRLVEAILTTGINLMALLRVVAKLHRHRTAVSDDRERLSYLQLWQQAEALAGALHTDHGIQREQKVAIACRNHAAAVKSIFAFSRLGTHVFLINPEMSGDQLLALEEHRRFDFYVYDEPLAAVFANSPLSTKSLPLYHPTALSIDRLAMPTNAPNVRLKKVNGGSIVIMTGGTTGQPKSASRKPSLFDFLAPFVALLIQVHLDSYRRAHIATPIYHGLGLSSLIVGITLGMELHITKRFDAARSCALIAQHQIEVMTLVPLMLQRLLNRDAAALSSLRCVISGAATLTPTLAREALMRLGPKLFNLYGTSEGGFAIMAGPDELARKPESIGKPIRGVHARIVDDAEQEVGEKMVGRLYLRSAHTTSKKEWVETGDLAYRDADGDIHLCGRVDDMIVSAGENVYPIELENVLLQHPDVAAVAVIGIADAEFGQRLKAVLATKKGSLLDETALIAWLKPRVSRHQMPAVVEFRDELPYTSLGKPDKKALRNTRNCPAENVGHA